MELQDVIEKRRTMNKTPNTRLLFLDNLRALMIILVVMIHTAVTYSGLGRWYYVENKSVDFISTLFFAFFQTFTQAFFMSLLFMIAGYFIPSSLDQKGTKEFLKKRFFRLGIPTLIYIFIIHPVNIKIIRPDVDSISYYVHGIRSFEFISWTGPLWFAVTLLILTSIYSLLRSFASHFHLGFELGISNKYVLKLTLLITVFAFLIRLFFPIGTAFLNLQFGYYAAYIIMFGIGIRLGQVDFFRKMQYPAAKKWFILTWTLGVPFWAALMLWGGPAQGIFLINGGLNWQAFAYALWESFVCVSLIIGLTGLFKSKFNSQNALQKFLSANAFGVYVFHAPVLISVSILFRGLQIYPVLKFFVVALLTLLLSFCLSYLLRKWELLRKIIV